jgi:16S rRNA (cytidine1402-2'-O)-methyltransferase
MGTLYLVATPIGNLEDISLRALRVLREAHLIAAEDTRTSRVLLRHYDIDTPLTSYHEHNKITRLDAIFAALEQGDVALISDAGTPGISDPGVELVRAAIARGVPVVPLPGANALLPALVASGLATDRFLFIGFLPRKPAALREALAGLAAEPHTLIAYESPHRLAASLITIAEVMGDERPLCVAREISKVYEEFWRGTAADAAAHFASVAPRGEITLVIAGAPALTWDEDRVLATLQERMAAGESASSAARAVARESGWPRSDVYALTLRP